MDILFLGIFYALILPQLSQSTVGSKIALDWEQYHVLPNVFQQTIDVSGMLFICAGLYNEPDAHVYINGKRVFSCRSAAPNCAAATECILVPVIAGDIVTKSGYAALYLIPYK